MTTSVVMTVTPVKDQESTSAPPGAEPSPQASPEAEKKATERGSLIKAELAVYEPQMGLSGQDLGDPCGKIEFHFNPKEFTVTKSAAWSSEPTRGAKKASPPEFNGTGPAKLSVEMFFDATTDRARSVVAPIETLFSCCVPTEKTAGDKKPLPPLVVFKWGQLWGFPAYITQVSAKYTLFSPDGTPLRATATVAMDEMPGVTVKQNPTSGSLMSRREHTLVAGDTLASLAYAEYGDPNLWRALADYNQIDDPLRLRPGTALLVPGVEDLQSTLVGL